MLYGDLNESRHFPGPRTKTWNSPRSMSILLCQLHRSHGDQSASPAWAAAHHPCIRYIVPHSTGKHHLDLVQRLFAVLLNGLRSAKICVGWSASVKPFHTGYAGPFRKVLHNGLLIAPVLDAVKEPSSTLAESSSDSFFPSGRNLRPDTSHGRPPVWPPPQRAAGAGGRLFKQQHDVLALHGGLADARTRAWLSDRGRGSR